MRVVLPTPGGPCTSTTKGGGSLFTGSTVGTADAHECLSEDHACDDLAAARHSQGHPWELQMHTGGVQKAVHVVILHQRTTIAPAMVHDAVSKCCNNDRPQLTKTM